MRRLLMTVIVLSACVDDGKDLDPLPYCGDVGCDPTDATMPLLCSSTAGPCTCRPSPQDEPVQCDPTR